MPDFPTDVLGPMVRTARKARGWSLETLAYEALGHRRGATISDIETGTTRFITRRVAEALAKGLDLDLAEIERQTAAANGPSSGEIQSDLDRLVRENGSLREALDNLKHLTHDGLIALATRFGIADAHRLPESALRAGLADKAEEYNRYRAQIEHIDERVAGLGNLKAAARDAADRLDFNEVEALLSRVDQVETEIAAQTKELRADNFLLQGRTQEAFDVLSAAADSFGGIDRLEPARRRLDYSNRLCGHGLRYGGDGLQLSIRMLKSACATVSTTDDPHLWAAMQNNLGIAFKEQGTRTAGYAGATLLAEAVNAYRAALEVCTQSEHPFDWVMIQNNLGTALTTLGADTAGEAGMALLVEAVGAYRAALQVRTRSEHPFDWAIMQNNLGAALTTQGTDTAGEAGTALLVEAVGAYRAALQVRTRSEHPLEWAMTQTNLGAALRAQGSLTAGDAGAALLAEAITANRAALDVRTQSEHPLDWAMTLENMAILEQTRAQHESSLDPVADLTAALEHVTAALTIFDPVHMPYNYQKATALCGRITKALDALTH